MVGTKGVKVLGAIRAMGVKVVALKMGVTQPLGLISPTLRGEGLLAHEGQSADPHSCWGWDPMQVAGSFSWGCWWTHGLREFC